MRRLQSLSFLMLALFLSGPGALAQESPGAASRDQVRPWRAAHEADLLREFAEFLAIPNLARDAPNIRRNAEYIAQMLERRGVSVRLLEHGPAPPVVYGELMTPEAERTVIVYAHYDGQPVDASEWTGQPWTPILRDQALENGGKDIPWPKPGEATQPEWRIYARSASDDKTPILGFMAALDALRASGIPPSVNLKFFFEGEEEAGSPHLAAILKENAELLRGDLWLICDGPVHQSRRPQIVFGARGIAGVEITLYGPVRALHSGHYGNWAPNPAAALANLLAGLRDPEGRILVAGFYDDVRPLTESERRALEQMPEIESGLKHALGLAATDGRGRSLAELVLEPALNIRGLRSGAVGEQARNAVPVSATASLDIRLVPNQTPQKVAERIEAHLRSQGYFIVHREPDMETRRQHARIVRLDWSLDYPAGRTSMDLPASLALTQAAEEALGRPVLRVPTLGGSVPMHLFLEDLRTPTVILPVANHDNNQHAANENLRLQNLWDAIELYAGVIARLGPVWRSQQP
jgi:acetylornithine deacetylase/succinyl-diaminopimelate desuccinylase-like protein